jgi:hypothetical protein
LSISALILVDVQEKAPTCSHSQTHARGPQINIQTSIDAPWRWLWQLEHVVSVAISPQTGRLGIATGICHGSGSLNTVSMPAFVWGSRVEKRQRAAQKWLPSISIPSQENGPAALR